MIKSHISKRLFINAHLLTIFFHIILAVCIFIFAGHDWDPLYNQICASILFVVSILALSPILYTIKYPLQIRS